MILDISSRELRDNLRHHLDQAAFSQERIRITRHGTARAALVPIKDLQALETLEVMNGSHGDCLDNERISRPVGTNPAR